MFQGKRGAVRSIAAQLFLFFTIGLLLPVLIGGLVSYVKSTSMIENKVSKIASLTVRQVNDKMNLIFKKLDDTTMMFLGSDPVRQYLEGSDDPYEHDQNYKEASKYLAGMMSNSPEILEIYLFDIHKENNIFSSNLTTTTTQLWDADWFHAILQSNGPTVWFGLSHISYLRGGDIGIPVFGLGRTIKSFETGKIIGAVFIEVRGDLIAKELSNVKFGKEGYTFIVDEDNHFIYHPEPSLYGNTSTFIPPDNGDILSDRQDNIILISEQLDNGWYITSVVSRNELLQDTKAIRGLFVWIAIGSLLYAIVIGYYVSRKIGRPLIHLSALMKRGASGDLSVRSNIEAVNELGQLSRSFNKMIAQIDLLIDRIAEEEAEKKAAEIRALRYQINPHFLYNTLNSIRWMAKLEHNDDVVKAISILVQLLEASLGRDGPFAKLGDELELLEKYMAIQQYRYHYDVQLEIDCAESHRQFYLPRMILQPIVENALFHGIAPKEEAAKIRIHVFQNHGDMIIEIVDEGVGIEEEKLPILLATEPNKRSGMMRIGLRNVHQTLQLYYGNRSGVEIESKKNIGTTVRLTITDSEAGEKDVQGTAG